MEDQRPLSLPLPGSTSPSFSVAALPTVSCPVLNFWSSLGCTQTYWFSLHIFSLHASPVKATVLTSALGNHTPCKAPFESHLLLEPFPQRVAGSFFLLLIFSIVGAVFITVVLYSLILG